jgi:hypothetical protein
MPDPVARIAVTEVSARGRWCGVELHEPVALFVEASEVVVRLEATGTEHGAPLSALRGAAWRAGTLSLFRGGEELHLTGTQGLDRAWHGVSQRACTLPEVARPLRALGLAHGASAEDHARFVAPFLQGRRRLESGEPVDWTVAGFDAATLSERTRGVLAAMAMQRHADRPPHRRAFEARLHDACERLFTALDRVAAAAGGVHEATDATRFDAWRAWAGTVQALFAETERAWRDVARHLAHEDRNASRRPGR